MTAPIADWLVKIGLAEYTGLFVENELDLGTLRDLTDADLKELGLPFGPRKRVLNALKQETVPDGERRQLTVLYCDIVGSTELAQLVDPEVLQTIIGLYEDTCAECISRYDGYIHQRQGDGLIAFFGFPFAHEGEAARAIRAGLEIIEAMAHLDCTGGRALKRAHCHRHWDHSGSDNRARCLRRNHEPRSAAPGGGQTWKRRGK